MSHLFNTKHFGTHRSQYFLSFLKPMDLFPGACLSWCLHCLISFRSKLCSIKRLNNIGLHSCNKNKILQNWFILAVIWIFANYGKKKLELKALGSYFNHMVSPSREFWTTIQKYIGYIVLLFWMFYKTDLTNQIFLITMTVAK